MTTLSQDYFETLYGEDDDPWSFASSPYEREKYDRSLAALSPRYERALEIGCSIGVFTERLAKRCGELVAIDISRRAIHQARIRCAHQSHVRIVRATFPHQSPPSTFDLITCCEVGYYWSDADLALARDRIAASLAPDGELLLVHFLPHVDDYVREGDEVHAAFLADARFEPIGHYRAERYRLDLIGLR
jgi:SAM-dependent methyltransferase